jgi:lipopolysaccharide/colanic/teichoic acid biosynthesis glycosyltransferase
MSSPAERLTHSNTDDFHTSGHGAALRPELAIIPSSGVATSDGDDVDAAAVRAEKVRRLLNVAVAAIGLILMAPLMLLIALAVKLTSPGPVFYTQLRVGIDRRRGDGGNWRRTIDYGGRLFHILKFRTMREARQDDQVWATADDPRITSIGRFLRKYRLDELPQLINVLKGEMNIVGPRPEQPKIFMSLREQISWYQRRQRVLPGITGWAQINLPYDRDINDVRQKVRYDLEYTARVSAAEDLRIMLRTVPVMVLGKGAW